MVAHAGAEPHCVPLLRTSFLHLLDRLGEGRPGAVLRTRARYLRGGPAFPPRARHSLGFGCCRSAWSSSFWRI